MPRYIRDVTEEEKSFIRESAHESHELGQAHASEFALEEATGPLVSPTLFRTHFYRTHFYLATPRVFF